MYLLYFDASGTPDLADSAQPTFVLLGLTMHEGNWFALEKRVAGLERLYQFPGVPAAPKPESPKPALIEEL
jgi:hypothetical protein